MHRKVLNLIFLVGLFFSLIVLASGMNAWRLPDNQQGYAPRQPIEYSHRLHAGELGIDCKFCHSAAEHGRHAGIPSTDVCMKCHGLVTAAVGTMSEQSRIEDEIKKLAKQAGANKTGGKKAGRQDAAKAKMDALKAGLDKLENPSSKLSQLYRSLGLIDPKQPHPDATAKSISWNRVHNLPDYVYFDHRAHVSAGVSCQKCHGPVESMERLRQFETLSMGWCVNCHRESTTNGIEGRTVHASTDCAVCHY